MMKVNHLQVKFIQAINFGEIFLLYSHKKSPRIISINLFFQLKSLISSIEFFVPYELSNGLQCPQTWTWSLRSRASPTVKGTVS